ncbi:MAG: class I SAM-dependent RNA methyltransferase [Acidimicrobiales bacterium]
MRPGEFELEVTGLAVGGDGVGRDENGRVAFVAGALPGERVLAVVRREHRRYAHAELAEVLRASPERAAPPCPEVGRGCGGCGLQHAALAAQRRWKQELVAGSLRRLGGVEAPVGEGPPLEAFGFRTTLRMLVQDGRAAFRRARGHDPVVVESCLVAHPLLVELVEEGRFGAAAEVTLRAGARTGDRLAVLDPSAGGASLPAGVVAVGAAELTGGRRVHYHEQAAGRRWRISARAFFQSRADGADALVDTARDALGGGDGAGRRLLDAYAGVGLLSAAWPAAELHAIESNADAAADAALNLADRGAVVTHGRVERSRPAPVDAVIADPARSGLGREGADAVAAAAPDTIALVSCDAASLGRDVGLLAERGYALDWCRLVDLFPHTPHVEVVSRLVRR